MHALKQIYILLLLCLPFSGLAQLQMYPLERKAAAPKSITTHSARVQSPTLPLPFWDDFSYTKDNYPDSSLWVYPTNKSVFVSDGQGINPPTINVATFDGLTANGTAYSPAPTDFQDFGYRDTLMSKFIDMSVVPLLTRDSVYFSFFYQWGGNGEAPDPNDFLRLEFFDDTGEWDVIATLRANQIVDPNVFNSFIYKVQFYEYYHPTFQFRFISYGRKSGRYDAWHIDYVYLNRRGEYELGNTHINDRAMTSPFTSVLGEYYAMPYNHFKSNFAENFTYPSYELNNLKGMFGKTTTNYSTYFTITNFDDGVPQITYDQFLVTGKNPPDNTIDSLSRKVFQITELPSTSTFTSSADSVKIFVKIGANSGDNDDDYFQRYDPINFLLNDTLTHVFEIFSHYAYDDGVSEYAMGLAQIGNQLAYRFDMKTPAKDTLTDVDIYYPFYADQSAASMQLLVLSNNNGTPGSILYQQSVDVIRTTNDKFTSIKLLEGVPVQGGFFIGYTQPVVGKVRIGLDRSHDTADRLYYRDNPSVETWNINDGSIVGSLMIRPKFGVVSLVTGIPEEEKNLITVFPNPNDGDFYIDSNTPVLGIITITGQPVNFSLEETGDKKRVSIENPTQGFYILKYQDGTRVSSAKICIRK